MHHHISAKCNRIAQKRTGHRVVDDKGQAMRMGHIGNGCNVEYQHARIAQAFGKDGAGIGLNGSRKGIGLAGVYKGGLNAKLSQANSQ